MSLGGRCGIYFLRYKQDVCGLAKFGDFDISVAFTSNH